MAHITTLFRPVGQAELDLIAAADWRAFPPRLPHQPIFYPVLTEAYAVEIARDWNTRDPASGYVGHVTRFHLPHALVSTYPVQTVGAARHQELWVPAADLPRLNQQLIGPIELVATFRPEAPASPLAMLRFDVFGRQIGIERKDGAWRLYYLDSPGRRQLAENLTIPASLQEDQLPGYLADLFHESASPNRSQVRRLGS